MLSWKTWKSLNESYDMSLGIATPTTVGLLGGATSFEEILEAKKKAMKKKMDFGGKFGKDDEKEDDEDAETGDGEVVDPSSPKDDDSDDNDGDEGDEQDDDLDNDDDDMPSDEEEDHEKDEDGDEDEDKNDNPVLMRMKKKMNKMKKKMSSSCKKEPKKEVKSDKKKMTAEDALWLKSVQTMMGNPESTRNFDGVSYGEDSLMPIIDINTGLAVNQNEPTPGEVGFAPETRFGLGNS